MSESGEEWYHVFECGCEEVFEDWVEFCPEHKGRVVDISRETDEDLKDYLEELM